MRFVALLAVRDEADIIGQCITHLLEWADSIFVFDTGSVDDTWEIVQSFALRDRRVRPLKKDDVFFSEGQLRGWMFHHARQNMTDGDWFLRVDADEIYHISPSEFVKTRIRKHESIVFHQYYNFCLLKSEVDDWEFGRESLADRARPIEQRRRFYYPWSYSEPRLCRYRETMQWPPTVSFPFNAGFQSRERIPIRHYPHRDPLQLERRCTLRAVMMSDRENRLNWAQPELHHWTCDDWRKLITPDDEPGILYLAPGAALSEVHFKNHIPRRYIRIAQRFAHQFLLPILDRRRPVWPEGTYPQRIPSDVVAQLKHHLNEIRG